MDEKPTYPGDFYTIMKRIIVGFSRPIKWKPFAKLIMAVDGTNYDHVYIKLHSDTYQRDVIYQASGLQVNFMSTSVFTGNNVIVKEFYVDVTDANYVKLMQFCIDNAGKPYSIKEILGFGWIKLNRLFGKEVSNPFQEGTNEFVCSILADYILENFTSVAAIKDFENVDPLMMFKVLDGHALVVA